MSAERVRDLFKQTFAESPQVLAVAPGRINLIGEHTDYNDGFVFPAAIDRQVWIAGSINDGQSEVFSAELGAGQAFDAESVEPAMMTGWAVYPAGMAWALRCEVPGRVRNIRAVLIGEVPVGSGISSSAALEMAFAVVWNKLCSLNLDNKRLAQIGQVCENQFVGVNSGIMDQMASAMGRAGHAMFLDTRNLSIEYAPVAEHLALVLCDTNKPRALTTSAYNERRSQCEAASKALGVRALRDATLEMLNAAHLDPVAIRRARHVITENERCVSFVGALERDDLVSIGRLMKESHQSLRDDYEVSCPQLDAMAEAAWQSQGCVGARMTGAGFGGACVALVEKEDVNDFVASTSAQYKARSGHEGQFLVCQAVDGAREIAGV